MALSFRLALHNLWLEGEIYRPFFRLLGTGAYILYFLDQVSILIHL